MIPFSKNQKYPFIPRTALLFSRSVFLFNVCVFQIFFPQVIVITNVWIVNTAVFKTQVESTFFLLVLQIIHNKNIFLKKILEKYVTTS